MSLWFLAIALGNLLTALVSALPSLSGAAYFWLFTGLMLAAALIASMLKVAVQSVAACAEDPGEFLGTLNRVLSEPLRGQLVSASYLWIDMDARKALYSAAGHPPMLRCNKGIEHIESNGLLFGISPDVEYPVRQLSLCPGDRLLLYTDGMTEPENTAGQAFGDFQLQRVLAHNSRDRQRPLAADHEGDSGLAAHGGAAG